MRQTSYSAPFLLNVPLAPSAVGLRSIVGEAPTGDTDASTAFLEPPPVRIWARIAAEETAE